MTHKSTNITYFLFFFFGIFWSFHIVIMSQTDMKFCSSYFLVDPTKASVLDLLLLLFFPNLTNTGFIDSPPDTLKSVRRTFATRWIIVLAVLIQKILMLLRKPFASIGRFLTYWPNLLTANGGFFKLILHVLTGNKSNNNILLLTISTCHYKQILELGEGFSCFLVYIMT